MPKSNRGGKRSTSPSAFSYQNQAGTATPQQAQNLLNSLINGDTIDYSGYMKLSEDEKADALEQIMKNDLPNMLATGSDAQKLLYYTEMEGKPQLVSDSALNKLPGKSFYRAVNDVYDRQTDVNYTSKQIYNQIAKGDFTKLSDSGGSAIGKGIYFADNYYHVSVSYGDGGQGRSTVMRMKLNSNAWPVSTNTVDRGIQRDIRRNSKMGKLYKKMNRSDARTIWAINNGYNVINTGNSSFYDYHSVIDRSAISLSTKTLNGSGTQWR